MKRSVITKALTIRQPWVWAICERDKRIENRPRCTHFRGDFYIHAGVAVPNWQPLTDVESRCGTYPDPELLPYGQIVAIATLVDCAWSDVMVGKWGEPGCFHYHLDNIRVLLKPRAAKGQLGFWNVQP